MNSTFQILKELPPYRKMYVSIPYGNTSEGLPVEFTKDDGTKWVANIKYGKEGLDYINKLSNPTEILVISNGCCFIIDRNQEKSITNFGYNYKQIIEFDKKFILIGTRDIVIVESAEKIESFKNLCRDFIKDVSIENGVLIGVLNDFNSWYKYDKTVFNIDLETYLLTKTKQEVELKKWWEFWKN